MWVVVLLVSVVCAVGRAGRFCCIGCDSADGVRWLGFAVYCDWLV